MSKVLIVDDEDFMRDCLATVVAGMGFDVAQAADGLEALDHFTPSSKPVALVVMDIRMPRLDGIQATRRIKEISPETLVVLISGNDQAPAGTQADAFLGKPFKVSELRELIALLNRDGHLAPRMAKG